MKNKKGKKIGLESEKLAKQFLKNKKNHFDFVEPIENCEECDKLYNKFVNVAMREDKEFLKSA